MTSGFKYRTCVNFGTGSETETYRALSERHTMSFGRALIFPITFGAIVVLFGFGFYHRYKLIVNPVEREERRKYNIQQALEFRRQVKEVKEKQKLDENNSSH